MPLVIGTWIQSLKNEKWDYLQYIFGKVRSKIIIVNSRMTLM